MAARTRAIVAALLFVLYATVLMFNAGWGTAAAAVFQPSASCPREPLDVWQRCIELGYEGAQNQVYSYGVELSRVNTTIIRQQGEIERQRLEIAVLRQQLPEVAWQKASDRLALWQRESQAYQDRWFYDQIYLRWRTHACRNGVPIQVACP